MPDKAMPIVSSGVQRRQRVTADSGRPQSTSSPILDWILTLPMLLLLPILLVPLLVLAAGGPTLGVAGTLRPAEPIVVSGTNYAKGEWVELRWDGAQVGWLPSVKTDASGKLVVSSVLPVATAPGTHLIEARMKKHGRDSKARPEVVAQVTVTVVARSANAPVRVALPPTPTPTSTVAVPTTAPTSTATPSPTAAAPTLIPSASPSASPSPSPSPSSPIASSPAATTGDPRLTCAGYPEPRVFLESQDHWSPIPNLGTLGHVHVGTCFPLAQTVGGIVHFDVRVVLYENKGTLTRVKMQDDTSTEYVLLRPNITPPDGGERVYWFGVNVDTRNMPDGVRQFRWYADVEHTNGNTQTARSSWPLAVENGKADAGVTGSALDVRFMNWYRVASPARNWGYIGPSVRGIPLSAVSGSFEVNVNCAVNGDANSPGITRSIVHIDPNFHHGSDGQVIYDGVPLNGRLIVNTGALAPGPHKLSIRCQQVDGDERHEGIGVFPFKVAP